MTDANLNEVFKQLGTLIESVTGLRRDMQQSETRAIESGRRADEHRAAVHHRVDDLVNDIGKMRLDVEVMKDDVAAAKEVTDEVTRWKLMGVGALFVTGIAAGAIASAVTYFWTDMLKAFRGI